MSSSNQMSSFDADRILASITDAFIALDTDWRFTYINDQAERVVFKKRDDIIGKSFWEVFPETVGSTFERQYRRAVDQVVTVSFEEFFPPLNTWFEVRAYPSPEGLSIFFQDINERKRIQEALRASREALRKSEARLVDTQNRLEAALSAGGVATWTWDLITDTLVVDDNFARLFSVSPESAKGGPSAAYFHAIHPDDRRGFSQGIADAIAGRDAYEADYRVVLPDGSHRSLAARGKVERDSEGRAISLPGSVVDVTEKFERSRRESFLTDLKERFRVLSDPEEVIAHVVKSVGVFLGASRCLFADIDIEADTCTIRPDYCADPSVASIEGVVPISSFGSFVVAEYSARRAVVVDDVLTDPIKAPPGSIAAYDAIGIRAHATVPVVHSARVVSCISLHSTTPRHWDPEDVELLRAVVERTWLTVEVLRQQRALIREAEALKEAHKRIVGILESITDAFFTLDSDFRFTYVNPQAERVLLKAGQELLGNYVWDVFRGGGGSMFDLQSRRAMSEQVSVSFEEFYPPLDAWFEVRAYPSQNGLSVFFQNVSVRKALEIERDQMAQREHNIAQQLQRALQPALPANIPGLAVGNFTKPALDEASIGGDFYDIFPLDKELFACVIADVSGKGLAAAQQLALIRNSLRTTLYLYRSPSQAAGSLNSIVTAHNLLVGFVTAWVGIYDAATGQITFTSCGHEPGLVRRANGHVFALDSGDPPLGISEHADYTEHTIPLFSGDSILLYTDGLSESGPNRRELLGTAGLMSIFEKMPTQTDIQAEAEALVEKVCAKTDGGFRDDVAVLLMRRC